MQIINCPSRILHACYFHKCCLLYVFFSLSSFHFCQWIIFGSPARHRCYIQSDKRKIAWELSYKIGETVMPCKYLFYWRRGHICTDYLTNLLGLGQRRPQERTIRLSFLQPVTVGLFSTSGCRFNLKPPRLTRGAESLYTEVIDCVDFWFPTQTINYVCSCYLGFMNNVFHRCNVLKLFGRNREEF